METCYLIKYGELALKGGNRAGFEKQLCRDIKRKLQGIEFELTRRIGRLYIRCELKNEPVIVRALSHTFGIVAFSRAFQVEKDMPLIEEAAAGLAESLLEQGPGNRFKIEARRSDKSFFLTSYEIACRLGDVLRARFPELMVDLHHPDWTLNVEIREAAYLYGPETKAPGGLPSGSSGKGLLLLSGGIDSPVAGYLMGKRGLKLDAAYFHTPPFTSEKAKEKVEHLTNILSEYLTGTALHVVPFTETQVRIKERARSEEVTLLMRACMVNIAAIIAEKTGSICLVTGESLGQVASQTPESIRFTGHGTDFPIFRPLIGLDKEQIVSLARKIGTFETSILPYEDCCTLFSPAHPLVRPDYESMVRSFQELEADALLQKAAAEAQIISF